MDAQLVALAAGGASALVGAMVTDAWGQARDQAVGLWRRHRPAQADAVDAELVSSQEELVAGTESEELLRARMEGRWQGRLERLLEEAAEDSETAADLRTTADVIAGLAAASGTGSVVQNVRAGRDSYTAARDLTIGVRERDASPDG
ncbi:hypothetical protein [Streptomyces sp. H27-S2]|uniref:hypothetical protein n=1 Tax=Streptomyces antarcticus TaxID=2996458 RepID=UPI00226FA790|nr:hypothetical protein [Streptomyces sp. H27-S2]MCY0955247.1 hypothetical protein [Streptomyces sp. H27-S2]